MQRISVTPRPDFRSKLEELGLTFHTVGGQPYWIEDAAYVLTEAEIDALETAGNELHRLCLEAVGRLVERGDLERFGLLRHMAEAVEQSWRTQEPALYGRFDFSLAPDGTPKMLEYNGDTPTALHEAAVAQWHWLESQASSSDPKSKGFDQFNSIHEALIERWKELKLPSNKIHFTCGYAEGPSGPYEPEEDRVTTDYLRDTALQAGLNAQHIAIEEIGWNGHDFIDGSDKPIQSLFKLYPWEQIETDEFGRCIPVAKTRWIEPPWKRLLSDKTILTVLWEMFPRHPNLLPSSFDPRQITGPTVAKPVRGREGANVILPGEAETDGIYGVQTKIYQAYCPVPCFNAGKTHAVLGVWTVGNAAVGLGIREDNQAVTTNNGRFVPHIFR